VTQLIVTYGYFAVAILVAVESFGVPLPGETILVAAALYAGHTHHLSVWAIFAVAAVAAIVGDNIGYLLGRTGGERLIRRYGRYVRLDETKLQSARILFNRHGDKVVFFGRFVSILRTYVAFFAGITRMPWRRFLIFNAAGGVLWAALYTFASYGLGNTFRSIETELTAAFAAVAVMTITAVIVVLRRRNKKVLVEVASPGRDS